MEWKPLLVISSRNTQEFGRPCKLQGHQCKSLTTEGLMVGINGWRCWATASSTSHLLKPGFKAQALGVTITGHKVTLRLGADHGSGNFDAIRQSVANNANLERIGNATGLVAFVNLNPGSLGVVSKAIMTATVEAVLGAVYLDSNMDTVKRVMHTLGLVSPWGGP